MNNLKSWAEAFAIFAKSGIDEAAVYMDDESINVDLHPANVSVEDAGRLLELRWFVDDEMLSFYHFM